MVLFHYSLIYSCFECSLRANSHVTFHDLPCLESLLAGSRITSDQAIRLAQGQLSNLSSLSGAPYKQPTHKTRPISKAPMAFVPLVNITCVLARFSWTTDRAKALHIGKQEKNEPTKLPAPYAINS